MKIIFERVCNILKGVGQDLYLDKYGILKFIGLIAPILVFLVWAFKTINHIRVSKRTRNDLHPYLDDDDIRKATQYYITTQCQDRPAEIDDELSDGLEAANKMSLVDFFLNQAFKNNKQRFYFILADAGMGKTTFMINLFIAYNKNILPRNYKMKFIPLGDTDADNHISRLIDPQKTILLLDAFDEDPKAIDDWEIRLNTIIKNAQNFRKVIITCRTQFFPNEESEKFTMELPKYGGDGGVHRVNKKYISPFSDNDIQIYLSRKYKATSRFEFSNPRLSKAKEILNLAPTLAARPMLLDKIDDLLVSNKSLKNEYQVFEELVSLWIIRESGKQVGRTKKNFNEQMFNFLLYAASTIYNNFRNGDGLFISTNQINDLAEKYSIQLPMIDLTSRSLLNRNPKGMIKFSHKTVLEYFLAKFDARHAEESIDFTTFNFGLKLRNQIIIESISKNSSVVFSKIPNGVFKRLIGLDLVSVLNVESVIINYMATEFELSSLRIFTSLKTLYIARFLSNGFEKAQNITISLNKNIGTLRIERLDASPEFLYIRCKSIKKPNLKFKIYEIVINEN